MWFFMFVLSVLFVMNFVQPLIMAAHYSLLCGYGSSLVFSYRYFGI